MTIEKVESIPENLNLDGFDPILFLFVMQFVVDEHGEEGMLWSCSDRKSNVVSVFNGFESAMYVS